MTSREERRLEDEVDQLRDRVSELESGMLEALGAMAELAGEVKNVIISLKDLVGEAPVKEPQEGGAIGKADAQTSHEGKWTCLP